MTDFIASEKGVPIRMPSVANLMIDSQDRLNPDKTSPWDFQITKNYSIMNGFFTRIATTEVVLEWCLSNIQSGVNNTLIVDVSGTGNAFAQTITLPQGFYTVEQALDSIAQKLTDLSGTTGVSWEVSHTSFGTEIFSPDGGEIKINTDTILSDKLGFFESDIYVPSLIVEDCPDLRFIRYLDFTSSQLTYCQDVKDNSTNTNNKDVLCRWYMCWDNEPQYDAYGYPILMGYTSFQLRRIFNPPKQIKWDANQPIGNLAFQVFDEQGNNLRDIDKDGNSDWLMTLQISEV